MKRMWVLWILAIIITLLAAYYQRMTGPTYPQKLDINFNGHEYNLELLRSHGGQDKCFIELDIQNKDISAELFYHRYPVNEKYTKVEFKKEGNKIIAELPVQPPAGKLQYYIVLKEKLEFVEISKENPVVIRFKGGVPAYILIPHIFFMFFAMMFANLTGLMAVFKKKNYKIYSVITYILLIAGGLILGPIVQNFAFNEYWAGVPNGWDLTDNKLLIAFIFWSIAVFANLKKERLYWIWIAAIVTLIIFSIPHSMFGSELNYSTGVVTQG
ncbi:MAG: hypothetical protein U9R42_07440 [Bacteroidota bacterium]|nr:hypothetical protein [Bacteroidota bacterium]